MKVRGVVKGKTIVLDEAPALADDEMVEGEVRAVPGYSGDGLYQVSAQLAPDQGDLRETRRYEVFPTTIFVEFSVVGAELMRAVKAEAGNIVGDGVAEYKIALAHMDGPPVSPVYYRGTTYFEDTARVPSHFYAKDLMRLIVKVIGADETETRIYSFNPRPYKGGKRATNELVNQIREELGV